MFLYDIIYEFFNLYIFRSNTALLGDWIFGLYANDGEIYYANFSEYLSHFSTIVVIVLLCTAVGLGVVWLFKTLVRIISQWAL